MWQGGGELANVVESTNLTVCIISRLLQEYTIQTVHTDGKDLAPCLEIPLGVHLTPYTCVVIHQLQRSTSSWCCPVPALSFGWQSELPKAF